MSVDFCRNRVYPRYPVASDWRPCTPWELVDGREQRMFRSLALRSRYRRAYVYRSDGGWRWKVLEVNRNGKVTEIGRSASSIVYTLAPNAFNPAEVSATTK